MRRFTLLIVLLSALATPTAAHAQAYAPITIDETNYRQLTGYLEQMPLKFATPVYNYLVNAEAQAQAAAAKPKVSEPPAVSEPPPASP